MASPSKTGGPVLSLVLRAVAASGQEPIAERLGKDTSTISRVLTGERGIRLDELDAFLEAIGLRVIQAGDVVLPEEEYRALLTFARKGINDIQNKD